jgi:hypothetical protein
MNSTVVRSALTAVFVGALSMSAWSGQVGQCIKAATGDFKDCKASCKDDYQTAKDACINKDHDCVDACREVRADCVDATGFADAIRACNATAQVAIGNCKQAFPPDSDALEQCIDNALTDAFVCRQGVRKADKPALAACRTGFKSCVGVCPPGSGPVDDPKQCRIDAKSAYTACGSACLEDFQVSKDACRNKDHACVETCRSNRTACDDPVQATLDATVAQCKATLQAAKAACNGDPTCIEQVEVVAFQCRDDARDAAKPGFALCRAGFKSCVQACPPPASPSGAFLD